MRIENETVEAFTIYEAKALDPIMVVIQDLGAGRGRITIECFGKAWSNYWGAMGNSTMREFFAEASAEYLSSKLARVEELTNKRKMAYLTRIVEAVKEALAS